MQVSSAQTDYALHGHRKCHYPNQPVPYVRAALFWCRFVFCFFNIKIYIVFVKISLALKMCLITTFFLLVINNASVSQQCFWLFLQLIAKSGKYHTHSVSTAQNYPMYA